MRYRYLRWMIRSALLCITVGMFLGLLLYLPMLTQQWFFLRWLRTTHVHLILVGGVIQMIMGVALWMFPRRKSQPYVTPEAEGLWIFWLLNSGIVLRSLAEPLSYPFPAFRLVTFVGMTLQVLAFLYFLVEIWGRVRSPSRVAPQ